MTFGDKLRELRESLGWTREELAYLSGVTEMCIKSYEEGINNPHFSNAQLLAMALKVSLDIFPFCGTESKRKLFVERTVEEIREERLKIQQECKRRDNFRRSTKYQRKWQPLARTLREQGLTFPLIAEHLYQQSRIRVSSTTVANWFQYEDAINQIQVLSTVPSEVEAEP